MTKRTLMMAASMAMALLAGTWRMQAADAQVPGFKRVELQRHDLSAKNTETVVARGEFEAGAAVPRHTHPGEEIGYVLEGELVIEIEGQPALKLKAGDTFFVPAGKIHTGKNPGKAGAKVISTYIVEKGKPLVTMVK
jgi:quercetin dioxygenase-like cupin family protein